MAKVLLISPPFYRLMGSHYNGIHLGLAYIASYLISNGHNVQIYNADFFDSNEYVNQRKLIENFDNYKSVLNDLNSPIWSEVKLTILDTEPDFVGIQMYTGTFKSAQNVAIIAKKCNSSIKVVVGGTHPTIDSDGTISFSAYDYLIRGEGEIALLELIEGKNEENIKGLTYKNSLGGVIHNDDRGFIEDLNSLPFPNRDKFYIGNGKIDVGALITSRGCPFRCTYCTSAMIWKGKTRFRSVENVLSEIEIMVRCNKVKLIRFQDDTFTLKRDRVVRICDGIIKRKLDIQWICDTRVDKIDIELLRLMKRAGCVRIKIGVESGSNKILKAVNKGINIDQIKNAVGLIKEVGIPLTIYLMIGFPDETDKDVLKTIRFAEEIKADYNSLGVISPYFGTEIYYDLLRKGFDFDKSHWEYFFHQSQAMIMNTNISSGVIKKFFELNEKSLGRRI